MNKTTTIKLSQVENFVRRELPQHIQSDLEAFRLLREADVQCAAYMYLREFLDSDSNWHVLAEHHAPQTGRYVDLVILQKSIPRVAIEIKWWRKNIGKKDRDSLSKALQDLGVNKAYWLSASVRGDHPPPLQKELHEKHRLHQIVVRANLEEAALQRWKELQSNLRRKPQNGKRLAQVK